MNYVNFFIKAKVSSFQLIFSCKVYWTGDAHFHCLNFVRCHINKVAEILSIETEQKNTQNAINWGAELAADTKLKNAN